MKQKQKLIDAIKEKNLTQVKKLIDNEGISPNYTLNDTTPLIEAVKQKFLPVVEWLVGKEGIDIDLFNGSSSVWDHIIESKDSTIFQAVLKKWKFPGGIKINSWINEAQRFWGSEKAVHALDIATSQLVGFDITQLYNKEQLETLLAQIRALEVTYIDVEKKTTVKLEGIESDVLLPLSVRILLEIAVENRCSGQEETATRATAELRTALYAYFISKIGFCAHSLRELGKLSHLAEKIMSQIDILADGKEFSFPSGWATHAVYIVIMKRSNGELWLRIDNAGGESKDNHYMPSEWKVCPRLLAKKAMKNLRDGEFFQYINDVIGMQYLPKTLPGNNPIDYVYDREPPLGSTRTRTRPIRIKSKPDLAASAIFPSFQAQLAGNCEWNSMEIGIMIRQGGGAQAEEFKRLLRSKAVIVAEQKHQNSLKGDTLAAGLANHQWKLRVSVIKELKQAAQTIKLPLIGQEKEDILLKDHYLELQVTPIPFKTGMAILLEQVSLSHWFDEKAPIDRRVFLIGQSGMGKTSLCQYILQQWSENLLWKFRFEAVLYFPLRYLLQAQSGETIIDLLAQYCFPMPLSASDKSLLKEAYDKGNLLLLLDGENELAELKEETLIKNFHDELLQYPNYVLTGRPYSMTPSNSRETDLSLKIEGFTPPTILTYVQKFFDHRPNKQDLINSFDQALKTYPYLISFCRSPLLLGLCCTLHEQSNLLEQNLTLTTLYKDIIGLLLKQHVDLKRENPQQLNHRTIYRSLLIKSLLPFIEHLAVEAIKARDHQTVNSAAIDRVCLTMDVDQTVSQDPLKFSLLKTIRQDSKAMVNSCYFAHQSFRDFLVASQSVRGMLKENKSIEHQILESRYDLQYRAIWPFTVGLLAFEEKEPKHLQKIFEIFSEEPREVGGFFRVPLFLQCLEECPPELVRKISFLKTLSNSLQELLKPLVDPQKPIPYRLLEDLSGCPRVLGESKLIEGLKAMLKNEEKDVSANTRRVRAACCWIHLGLIRFDDTEITVDKIKQALVEGLKDKQLQYESLRALIQLKKVFAEIEIQEILWQIASSDFSNSVMLNLSTQALRAHYHQSPMILRGIQEKIATFAVPTVPLSRRILALRKIKPSLLTLISESEAKQLVNRMNQDLKECAGDYKVLASLTYYWGLALQKCPSVSMDSYLDGVLNQKDFRPAIILLASGKRCPKEQVELCLQAALFFVNKDHSLEVRSPIAGAIVQQLKRNDISIKHSELKNILSFIVEYLPEQLLEIRTEYLFKCLDKKNWEYIREKYESLLTGFPTAVLFDACVKSNHKKLWDILINRLHEQGLALVINQSSFKRQRLEDSKEEVNRGAQIGIIYERGESYQQSLTDQQVEFLQEIKSVLTLKPNASSSSSLTSLSITTSASLSSSSSSAFSSSTDSSRAPAEVIGNLR